MSEATGGAYPSVAAAVLLHYDGPRMTRIGQMTADPSERIGLISPMPCALGFRFFGGLPSFASFAV